MLLHKTSLNVIGIDVNVSSSGSHSAVDAVVLPSPFVLEKPRCFSRTVIQNVCHLETPLPIQHQIEADAGTLIVRDLGLIGYAETLELQQQLVSQLRDGGQETLLLLEHSPVYTVGAAGDLANVLDPDVSALRVNRGGDVTYHGPGQLVCYPILDLSLRGRDLHSYLRFLERFLVQMCTEFEVEGFAVPGRTGVWTEGGKLAAIGVGVRRWVSMHGFSLNVSADTSAFDRINPCGMAQCRITSLSRERGDNLPMQEVKDLVRKRFQTHLDQDLPRR
jgi:lipoyl(octanoyl) transferase